MARKKVDFKNNEDIVPVEENFVVESVELPPSMSDTQWQNYVMSHFEADELEDGRPKVDGLRRVVRKLIGPIISGKASVKQVPTLENGQRSTVEYTVVVLNINNSEYGDAVSQLEFTDAADAWHANMPPNGLEFARFPVAIASTRAEVRALRKVLNLKIAAAEEISNQPLAESGVDGQITEGQITKIDIKCQEHNINVMKFINMGKVQYKEIKDVSYDKAIKMFQLLTDYQRKIRDIPPTIQGYIADWRK